MHLYFQKMGRGPVLFILHGLYGSSDNWVSVGRRLADHFTVYLVDQRNHGRSPHSPSHTFTEMAEDLNELLETEGIQRINLSGHSMGGKTAMVFAAMYPSKVESLIVIDIAPDGYGLENGSPSQWEAHRKIIDAMLSLDIKHTTSRTEIEQQLEEKIHDKPTRQFILKNLQRNQDHGFSWKLNIIALSDALSEMMSPIEIGRIDSIPVLFIKGENSSYLSERHLNSVRRHFPQSEIISVPGAGHWVHADQPQRIVSAFESFLTQPES